MQQWRPATRGAQERRCELHKLLNQWQLNRARFGVPEAGTLQRGKGRSELFQHTMFSDLRPTGKYHIVQAMLLHSHSLCWHAGNRHCYLLPVKHYLLPPVYALSHLAKL